MDFSLFSYQLTKAFSMYTPPPPLQLYHSFTSMSAASKSIMMASCTSYQESITRFQSYACLRHD